MPIYEYKCGKCGKEFEELVSSADTDAPPCPECGANKSERLMSAPQAPVADGGLSIPGMPAPPTGGCGGGGFK